MPNFSTVTLGELLASDIADVRRHAVGILKALDRHAAAVISQQDKDLMPKATTNAIPDLAPHTCEDETKPCIGCQQDKDLLPRTTCSRCGLAQHKTPTLCRYYGSGIGGNEI